MKRLISTSREPIPRADWLNRDSKAAGGNSQHFAGISSCPIMAYFIFGSQFRACGGWRPPGWPCVLHGGFPTVSRELAVQVLEECKELRLAQA